VSYKHKLGADKAEAFTAVEVDPTNRKLNIGPAREIEVIVTTLSLSVWTNDNKTQGWTAFDFPGRGDKVRSNIILWI
jgi:alpha-amylase